MPLAGIPLKAKIIGIAVLALLTFSLVGTTLEALDQIAQEQSTSPQTADGQLVSQRYALDQVTNDDGAFVGTLKYVCPFH